MSKADVPAVERIIVNTINETARGNPDALAARIIAALGEAGYRIVPANGMEDTALGSQPFDELAPQMRPLSTPETGRVRVKGFRMILPRAGYTAGSRFLEERIGLSP